jgi:tight adherence protein B
VASHLGILIAVYFLMAAIVEVIPELYTIYRERYMADVVRTTRELDKFFLNIKPTNLLVICLVIGVGLGVVTGSWVLAVSFSLSGLVAPKILLSVWKGIRSSQVDAQLMDALVLIGNSLKSGLDIAAGIERVATTMKPPISEEFGLVLNAYRLGTPLETALMDMTSRIRSRTLETVVYAISIQRETGGNLIKTFEQLVLTIREEDKLQKKVKAITAQGRTQIFFLAGFPWALAALFFFMSPDFMRPALANPWGQLVAIVLIVWEAIGVMVTKKIVTVDI